MRVDKTKWKSGTIDEYCIIQLGTRIVRKDVDEGEFPVYGGGGATFTTSTYNRENAILISRFAISKECTRFVQGRFFLNDSGLTIIPKGDTLLFHYLKWHIFAINDKIYSLGKGVAQKNLDMKRFPFLLLNIPPIDEQQVISSELKSIQTMIDGYNALLEDLDALAQSIFMEMFGDPLDNPKGWKKDLLENIVHSKCPISYGIVQPGEDEENGIPVIRPVDLTSTYVSLNGLKKVSPSISNNYRRTILRGDEILLCVRGTTGIVSLATEELKGCNVTRGIVPLYFDSQNRWFIYYCFKSSGINNEIQKHTKGATLKQINIGELRRISFPIPPLHLQQQFAKQVEAIEKQKDLLREQLKDAETLMAERMQYYFS